MRRNKFALMMSILTLTIGFAAVTTTLVINGAIGLGESEDFKVVFTSAKLDGRKRNDLIGATKKTINYSTEVLKSVNDKSILDYEVTNTSRNYDADVAITCAAEDNDYVDISYEPKKMVVKAGESDTGSITVKLIKIATKDEEINLTCTLVATPVERESLGEEYILDKGLMIPVNYVEAVDKDGFDDSYTEGYFWDYKESITDIVFEDQTVDRSNAAYSFDVSKNQDESVMTYLVKNKNDNSKYTLYFQSEDKVILNPVSEYFFKDFTALENIDGLDRVNTENVTNMRSMFRNCNSLTSFDLSNFNTNNVTDMNSMFYFCSSLTNLDLSSFDTSLVTAMHDMFGECHSLTSLDFSGFDTHNVTDMNGMFDECNSLTTLDVSHFDTSNVMDMSAMFGSCHNLTNLVINGIDTHNVKEMAAMFCNCYSLISLDLTSFDTSNVTDMNCMFGNCYSLISLDVSSFNFENVTNVDFMFSAMPNDTEVLVKDEATQNNILNDLTNRRPSSWTTANVVVKS